MLIKKCYSLILLFLIVMICYVYGCSFQSYEIEKKLFSWKITDSQLVVLKKQIQQEGYNKISKDNYPYEGAFVTQYKKEMLISPYVKKFEIYILLHYKNAIDTVEPYRNFGIEIFSNPKIYMPR